YPGGAIASDGTPWTHEGRRLEGDVWPLPATAYAHPRSAGTFSRFLRIYARERNTLTFMEAIEKASLIPARILEDSVPQMKNKGRIRVGADADIIVFDPKTVADRATFEKPAATSIGMLHVVVNGTPVIANRNLIRKALPGKAIRKSDSSLR
ncbi:MAG: amidohydrolase family protein, partial [Steroidobacteraceae bacterium]